MFAKIRYEQGTATARPSKRVPYSVQQTGGDDRRDSDKNGCDQVMQHAVGHVTLLGWLWIWKGQLRCSWYQSQQTLRRRQRRQRAARSSGNCQIQLRGQHQVPSSSLEASCVTLTEQITHFSPLLETTRLNPEIDELGQSGRRPLPFRKHPFERSGMTPFEQIVLAIFAAWRTRCAS